MAWAEWTIELCCIEPHCGNGCTPNRGRPGDEKIVVHENEVIRPGVVTRVEEANLLPSQGVGDPWPFSAITKGARPCKVVEMMRPSPARYWLHPPKTASSVIWPAVRRNDVLNVKSAIHWKETILASVCCSSPDRLSDEIVAHAMLPLLLQSLEQILQLQVRRMIHSLHYPKTGASFLR